MATGPRASARLRRASAHLCASVPPCERAPLRVPSADARTMQNALTKLRQCRGRRSLDQPSDRRAPQGGGKLAESEPPGDNKALESAPRAGIIESIVTV